MIMSKTAWGQEFDAKMSAWDEINKLKRENKELKAEREALNNTPAQCPREILAEAGRAGFVAGYNECWRQVFGTTAPEYSSGHTADLYAERIHQGGK